MIKLNKKSGNSAGLIMLQIQLLIDNVLNRYLCIISCLVLFWTHTF